MTSCSSSFAQGFGFLPFFHDKSTGLALITRTAPVVSLFVLRGGLGRVGDGLLLGLHALYVTLAVAGLPG
jgi:hypothetical protein